MLPYTLTENYVQTYAAELQADGDRNRLARPLLVARRQRRRQTVTALLAAAIATARRSLLPTRDPDPVCCT